MSTRQGIKPGQDQVCLAGIEPDGAADSHAPRQLSFGENVILTIKVLAGFGLLGGVLWAINLWTSAS